MRYVTGWIGRWLLTLCVVLGFAPAVGAQTPTVQADKLGWSQTTTASELSLLSFAVFIDGARQPLADVSCVVSSTAGVYDCVAPFPAMTPGAHTIELVAIRTEGTLVVESAKSAPFAIRLVVGPAVPAALKIVR